MRYEAPKTTKEAVALLAGSRGKAFVLAGGTDLLARMKAEVVEPDLVVDVKRIPAMTGIRATPEGFRIGAAVPCCEIGEHGALGKAWPGVVEAARLIGSEQIQGRCTLAGNLCNASPAADSVPALIAAGAKAVVVGARGRRTIAVAKIASGPGQTCLARGEVIEALLLPRRPANTGDAYLRFTPRTEMDIAVAGAAVCLTLARGKVKTARVVLGAVAPTAILVPEAAQALIGTRLDDEALARLAAACSSACRAIDDKRGTAAYRTRIAGVLARRAATLAFQRAGGL
jgi:carbon-monoxide dehydrogenase medium subunit